MPQTTAKAPLKPGSHLLLAVPGRRKAAETYGALFNNYG